MFIKEEVKKVDRNRVFTPFCDLKYLNGCMGESRKHKFDDSNNPPLGVEVLQME